MSSNVSLHSMWKYYGIKFDSNDMIPDEMLWQINDSIDDATGWCVKMNRCNLLLINFSVKFLSSRWSELMVMVWRAWRYLQLLFMVVCAGGVYDGLARRAASLNSRLLLHLLTLEFYKRGHDFSKIVSVSCIITHLITSSLLLPERCKYLLD